MGSRFAWLGGKSQQLWNRELYGQVRDSCKPEEELVSFLIDMLVDYICVSWYGYRKLMGALPREVMKQGTVVEMKAVLKESCFCSLALLSCSS